MSTLAIFVFERPNGTLWADYSESYAKRNGKVVHTIVANTRAEIEGVIKDPGPHLPERVRALAERALHEFLARGQRPAEPEAPIAVAAAPRVALEAWWRRLFG